MSLCGVRVGGLKNKMSERVVLGWNLALGMYNLVAKNASRRGNFIS